MDTTISPEKGRIADGGSSASVFFRNSMSEPQGVTGFFKHRFGKDHLLGSILTLGFIATSAEVMVAGHKQGDPVRKWTSAASILQNSAFLASKRGGIVPEGENPWDRMLYSLQHPNSSAVHFNALTASPISMIQKLNDFQKGLADLKTDKNADKTRIFQGVLGMVSTAMIFAGFFRMKREENLSASATPKSRSPDNNPHQAMENAKEGHGLRRIKNVVRHAWRVDPSGATARTMNAAVQVFMAAEGLGKKRVGIGGGDELIRAAALQLAMIGTQFYYLYDRLLQDSQAKGPSASGQGR